MLEKAEVGQAADDGTISPGFKVSYRFEGDDDVETFLLGAREMADDDIQVFSPQSPLGSALIGARVGETVSYQAPNGKHLKVVIVEAGPYTA
jgi:transcription elongation factor GreA